MSRPLAALPPAARMDHERCARLGDRPELYIYWIGSVPGWGRRGVASTWDHQGICGSRAADPWGKADRGSPVTGSTFQPGGCLVWRVPMGGLNPGALAGALPGGRMQA